ncbi:ecotin family protein [Chryseobacterium sp. 3008163]|uniref:ecotin family protein n=1 Tax=Chryseobacterium sp. 3008163 TaxID=2478663 RepID=UPI0013EA0482|nr:ecotin family protein [Chryseobacterium sp. 3008163]
MKEYYTLFLLLLFVSFCFSQKVEYPEAKDGYKKVELKLPSKIDNKDFKIEIFLVSNMKLDDCENASLNAKLETKFLVPPARYAYYELSNPNIEIITFKNGNCSNKKIDKKVYNYPKIEEYRSVLPYTFYIPKNMDIEYRIWKVEPKYIEVK